MLENLMPYLAIVIVILTGWGIVKNLQVNVLLLFSGLALNHLAVLGGVDSILPRGAHSTGWVGFDLFAQLSALSRSQVASTGFIILIAGGFAGFCAKTCRDCLFLYFYILAFVSCPLRDKKCAL